jgi:hypothetical protein
MAQKKKCKHCNRIMTIVGRGFCGKYYSKLVPKEDRRPIRPYTRNKSNNGEYPKKVMIPCWETSDGKEWGNEVNALRHQLEIERNRKTNGSGEPK